MNNELTTAPASSGDLVINQNLGLQRVNDQINMIQAILKENMKEGVDFGTIPGTKNPSLWKPGAEKIVSGFMMNVSPKVIDLSANGNVRYRVEVTLSDMKNGTVIGTGVGECSSDEEKYKWRAAVSKAEFDYYPKTHRRTKFRRNKKTGKVDEIIQVMINPADIANTVLKIAKKRSLVDGVLTCTAASSMFTQDTEDMPEEILNQGPVGQQPVQQPRQNNQQQQTAPPAQTPPPAQKAAPPPQQQQTQQQPQQQQEQVNVPADAETMVGMVEALDVKTGTSSRGPWTLYLIKVFGCDYSTFSDTFYEVARQAQDTGLEVEIVFTHFFDGKYDKYTIHNLTPFDRNAPAEHADPAQLEPQNQVEDDDVIPF